ncbi:MAG: D-alanine--D-alanine ligase [Rickettsiales bacterium]|jgi:D-alanine-D-alanine ligase|nr:D-alanine--D-alanine ligase [Rickettsiales bacterium]
MCEKVPLDEFWAEIGIGMKNNNNNPQNTRTLGPVSDLERHLPTEWWKKLFTSLYLKTDGDVVENDTNTVREVDVLVESLGLKSSDAVLDLCCGQGRHALELARRGFQNVKGVDRSRYLVRLARKRAQQQQLNVNFSEGDARRIRFTESSLDVVYLMGNSFGYFEREEDDAAVLEAIKRVLKSEGKIALDITDGEWMRANFEKRSWEWVDQDHFVCRERSLSTDGTRIISREVVVHAEKGVLADQFYAERLYDKDQIAALLKKVDFGSVTLHDKLSAGSTRGQDLGMMAHRLFITAQAPKKKPKAKTQGTTQEITVLLGDPRLPDPVKKDGKFNPEDLQTIETLKKALSTIDGYNFRYMDSHPQLLTSLQKKVPSFVLNLCDEGYMNQATEELHVPAMLEMFGVPYSGAGPAALGLCYNKAIVRAIAAGIDVPVPEETYYDPSDQSASIPSIFPALLKPGWGDSSIGITKDAVVHNAEQLMAYLDYLRQILPNRPVLIQEFLEGKEYSVGIIGNPGNYSVLPVLEVDYSKLPKELPKILSYESKWEPESPYWSQIAYKEAELPEEERRRLVDHSIRLFERTGCRDYARFDYRADRAGTVKLLEVNPNPGWCWDGKLNLMAQFGGMSYSELLRDIVTAAVERCGKRNEADIKAIAA